jgi:S1-C subfamily serine protease
MTPVDLLLIAGVVLAALMGYRQGLLVGAAGLVGFLIGGALGLWLAPVVLGGSDPGLVQSLLAVGIVLVAAVGLQLLGSSIAGRARDSVESRPARVVDSLGGSVISVAGLLLACWLVASLLVEVTGPGLGGPLQRSRVLAAVDRALPATAQDLVSSFESVVDASGFPTVFGPFGLEQIVPVPEPDVTVADPVVAAAADSLVKVTGIACDRGLEGSGFVYASERVMTNAHVIAGVAEPFVQIGGVGPRLPARVVVFDPDRDVAVLAVPGLTGDVLAFDPDVQRGEDAVVAGFPGDGPLVATPARVRGTIRALGEDIYSEDSVSREVVAVRAQVRPGNSGGPLLDADGRVVGVIFAASTTDADTGYALSTAEVAAAAAAGVRTGAEISSGRCA